MLPCFTQDGDAIAIFSVNENQFTQWLEGQNSFTRAWLANNRFTAKPGTFCLLPNSSGQLSAVIYGSPKKLEFWSYAELATRLPQNTYYFADDFSAAQHENIAAAWALQSYVFDRYKKSETPKSTLKIAATVRLDFITQLVESIYLIRDLVNTPSEDMGPEQLAQASASLAQQHSARFSQVVGDDLLTQNFPAIHAVGRSSRNEPRLLEITWGEQRHPKLTLIGKGICFDTGGLDIKNSSGMALMKKDMGGAAHVLGLAHLIMSQKLPVQLHVLIPACENLVSARAYKPGDVFPTRAGKTIEIGNTDAEGRVVLADAIARACETSPDLIIDIATLTGAARIALGTDIPVLFCDDDELVTQLKKASAAHDDPIWQLPLYAPYRDLIDSPIADLNNSGNSPYAGAITAALFLKEFVTPGIRWAHFDLMAWNLRSRPGRPEGGEAMGMRAIFAMLLARYCG